MRLLKGVIFFSLLMMIVASCAPQGSLTPRSAFYDLRAAFQQSDAAAFERLLSQASYRKIRHITALFSRLNDRQHESLSALYKIPQERLQKLSVREYLKILLAMDRGRRYRRCRVPTDRGHQPRGKSRGHPRGKRHGARLCQGRAVLEN